jgi:hypothetical protein
MLLSVGHRRFEMATKKVPPNVMILGDEYEWWVTSDTPWVEEGFLSVSYGQLRDAPEQIEEGISHIYDVYKKIIIGVEIEKDGDKVWTFTPEDCHSVVLLSTMHRGLIHHVSYHVSHTAGVSIFSLKILFHYLEDAMRHYLED